MEKVTLTEIDISLSSMIGLVFKIALATVVAAALLGASLAIPIAFFSLALR